MQIQMQMDVKSELVLLSYDLQRRNQSRGLVSQSRVFGTRKDLAQHIIVIYLHRSSTFVSHMIVFGVGSSSLLNTVNVMHDSARSKCREI